MAHWCINAVSAPNCVGKLPLSLLLSKYLPQGCPSGRWGGADSVGCRGLWLWRCNASLVFQRSESTHLRGQGPAQVHVLESPARWYREETRGGGLNLKRPPVPPARPHRRTGVLPSYSDSQGRQRSECPELRGEAPAQVAFDVPATVPEWEEGGKIQ